MTLSRAWFNHLLCSIRSCASPSVTTKTFFSRNHCRTGPNSRILSDNKFLNILPPPQTIHLILLNSTLPNQMTQHHDWHNNNIFFTAMLTLSAFWMDHRLSSEFWHLNLNIRWFLNHWLLNIYTSKPKYNLNVDVVIYLQLFHPPVRSWSFDVVSVD